MSLGGSLQAGRFPSRPWGFSPGATAIIAPATNSDFIIRAGVRSNNPREPGVASDRAWRQHLGWAFTRGPSALGSAVLACGLPLGIRAAASRSEFDAPAARRSGRDRRRGSPARRRSETFLDLDVRAVGGPQDHVAPLDPAVGHLHGHMVLAVVADHRLDRHARGRCRGRSTTISAEAVMPGRRPAGVADPDPGRVDLDIGAEDVARVGQGGDLADHAGAWSGRRRHRP